MDGGRDHLPSSQPDREIRRQERRAKGLSMHGITAPDKDWGDVAERLDLPPDAFDRKANGGETYRASFEKISAYILRLVRDDMARARISTRGAYGALTHLKSDHQDDDFTFKAEYR